jgi:hypothetical protein
MFGGMKPTPWLTRLGGEAWVDAMLGDGARHSVPERVKDRWRWRRAGAQRARQLKSASLAILAVLELMRVGSIGRDKSVEQSPVVVTQP